MTNSTIVGRPLLAQSLVEVTVRILMSDSVLRMEGAWTTI